MHDKQKIAEMYASGMGAKRIAKALNIHPSAVYYVLKKLGVARRSMTDAQRLNSPLPDEQLQEAISEYQAGAIPASTLAEKYGVSTATMLARMRKAGVKIEQFSKVGRFTEKQKAEIAELFSCGVSQTEIGRRFGVSQTAISRLLRKHGIDRGQRQATGERHGNWKGGVAKQSNGYVLVRPDDGDEIGQAMTNHAGYVQQHRLVMARALCRPLHKSETVHHIDGDRTNNRLSNLQLRIGYHGKHIRYECACCGSQNLRPIDL